MYLKDFVLQDTIRCHLDFMDIDIVNEYKIGKLSKKKKNLKVTRC